MSKGNKVDIVIQAVDNASETVKRISKAFVNLDKTVPKSIKSSTKELMGLSKKTDLVTGSLDFLNKKLGGVDTKLSGSSFLSKSHNYMDGLSESTGNFLDNVSKGAYAINPMLGVITQLGSTVVKTGQIMDKAVISFAEPFYNVIEKSVLDIVNPINTVNRGIANWRSTLTGVASAVYLVKGAFNQVSSFMEGVDSYTTNKARLSLANQNFTGSNQMTDEAFFQSIYGVAERTRSSFQDTSDIVSKMGINVGKSFKDAEQLLRFTETVSKSLTIGGASGTEKQSSLLQLTQALASGTLQGDELRSLMENAPVYTQLLSDELGVTRGELKKLGSEGKLTTDAVIEATLAGYEKMNEMFETIPKRFSDIKQSISRSMQEAMSDSYEAISGLLSSDGFDNLLNGLTPAFELVGDSVEYVVKGIDRFLKLFSEGKEESAVKNFTNTFSSLGLILGGLFKGGVFGNLITLGGVIQSISQITDTNIPRIVSGLSDFAFKGISVVATSGKELITNGFPKLTQVFNKLAEETPKTVRGLTLGFKEIGSAFATNLPDVINSLGDWLVNAMASLRVNIPDIANTIFEVLQSAIQSVGNNADRIGAELGALVNTVFDQIFTKETTVSGDVVSTKLVFTEKAQAIFDELGKAVSEAASSFLANVDLGDISHGIELLKGKLVKTLTENLDVGEIMSAVLAGKVGQNKGKTENLFSRIGDTFKNGIKGLFSKKDKGTDPIEMEIDPDVKLNLDNTGNKIKSETKPVVEQSIREGVSEADVSDVKIDNIGESIMTSTAVDIASADSSVVGNAVSEALATELSKEGLSENIDMSGVMTEVANKVREGGAEMSNAMTENVTVMGNAVTASSGLVTGAIATVLNQSKSIALGFAGSFQSVGMAISQGIARGINAGSGIIQGSIKSVMSSALATARASIDVNSPSKVFRDMVGLPIPEGIAVGINQGESMVTNAISDLTKSIMTPINASDIASSISYNFNSADIEDEKLKMSDEIRAEILSATKIKFIERFSTVNNSPKIEVSGAISEKADAKEVLKEMEKILADLFKGDLSYA